MELIRPFDRLGKGDAGIAGGKGASLGEMTQAGILVPPGFVVLASAFERFLDEAGLNQELDTIFHSVNHNELRTVELASERIQGLIVSAKMPEDVATAIRDEFAKLGAEYVAVRSSATAEDGATAAWAGQLETYLNTTGDDLLANVQKCWASLFTPRAIFYRFEKGMHGSHISVAVVVQKMVQSEVSGIAFSVHPVTEDYNQLIIEAGFGLGEAIVSGQVTPDSFVVEKEPRRIIDKNISYQSRALWRAKEGGNEWRELSQPEGEKPALTDKQVLQLAQMVLGIEKHYGFPCDIEWAFEAGQFYITQSRPITTLSKQKNAVSDDLPHRDDYIFAGHYHAPPFNAWFWAVWYVPELAKEIGLQIANPGYVVVRNGDVFPSRDTYSSLHTFVVLQIAQRRFDFFTELRKRIDSETALLLKYIVSCEGVRASESLSEITNRFRRITFYWAVGYFAGVEFEKLLNVEATKRGLNSENLSDYIERPTTPLMRRQRDLHRLKEMLVEECGAPLSSETIKKAADARSDIREALESHLSEYAWLGFTGFIGEPFTLDELIRDIATLGEETKLVRKEGLGEYAAMASDMLYLNQCGAELYQIIGFKSHGIVTKAADELGVALSDIHFLTPPELYDAAQASSNVHAIIQKRKASNVVFFGGRVVDDAHVVELVRARFAVDSETLGRDSLKGQCGNKGTATGPARVIMGKDEFQAMKPGDILMTSMTTPDFVPIMQKAAAIVTDMGGLLSHAVIMSRELGKPCVIGTKSATSVFKDGDMVEVYADNGVVRKI